MEKFKTPESLQAVAEFHETFGHPVLTTPAIPGKARCELRVSLLQEELNELKEAIEENDLVAIADALSDIQYVLSGAIHEFGLGHSFYELFNEVQRSNMSKACHSREEAEETIRYYQEKSEVEAYWKQKGDLFLVYRKSDDKTLKSINYSEARLRPILEKHSGE